MSILTLDGVHTAYGPTRVLHGLSLTLDEGAALAVLGRNGAGKTTLLKTIIGLVPVQAGTISLAEAGDITRVPSHRRARLGIGYVPQGRRLFPRLTVAENIRMGTTVRPDGADEKVLDAIYEAFPKLAERREQKAGTLSGGEQQMVAFGRAIAMSPRVLLLDEPSEGLAPVVVDALIDAVVNLSEWLGFGILIVEQNVAVAFEAAQRTIVLERGAVVREGTPDEMRHDPDLTRILAI